ncbi:MAG: hypothetical protein GQ532_00335, partial [Methylomarinum sp.]|nr:hypothetical protein [Methylomarinum sp.]
MNEYDIKRLALVLAIQAEIEGMKIENMQLEKAGFSYTYTEADFFKKAEELRVISSKHYQQLWNYPDISR